MGRAFSDAEFERLGRFCRRWGDLPAIETARLRPAVTRGIFAKGEQLVRVGDRPARIFFVLSGILRAYYVTPDGAEFVRSFIPEDEIAAPLAAVIANEPSNLIIEALEDAEVLTFDAAILRDLCTKYHAWSEFGRRLAERYYLLRERHAHHLLTLDGRERYMAFVEQAPHLAERVPQKHIAGYLGMTPVSLNRVVAALTKKSDR